MFHEAVRIYTYVMHTHTLMNVVAADIGIPQVLIRAAEPHEGQFLMESRRPGRPRESGQTTGKLTKAMGISMNDYGGMITEPPLYITEGFTPEHISTYENRD